MRRRNSNNPHSKRAFTHRARKTANLNTRLTTRGGIRL